MQRFVLDQHLANTDGMRLHHLVTMSMLSEYSAQLFPLNFCKLWLTRWSRELKTVAANTCTILRHVVSKNAVSESLHNTIVTQNRSEVSLRHGAYRRRTWTTVVAAADQRDECICHRDIKADRQPSAHHSVTSTHQHISYLPPSAGRWSTFSAIFSFINLKFPSFWRRSEILHCLPNFPTFWKTDNEMAQSISVTHDITQPCMQYVVTDDVLLVSSVYIEDCFQTAVLAWSVFVILPVI